MHLDVGHIREATVRSQTEQFNTDRIRCNLKGHGQRSVGSKGRIFLDIVVHCIRKFLPLTDEVGKFLCISLWLRSNTVMEISVLLQSIMRIVEVIIRLYRA